MESVLLIACLLVLLANVGILSVFIKLYTEILKIEHVKRIGR